MIYEIRFSRQNIKKDLTKNLDVYDKTCTFIIKNQKEISSKKLVVATDFSAFRSAPTKVASMNRGRIGKQKPEL